jgi:hypothetical protein
MSLRTGIAASERLKSVGCWGKCWGGGPIPVTNAKLDKGLAGLCGGAGLRRTRFSAENRLSHAVGSCAILARLDAAMLTPRS